MYLIFTLTMPRNNSWNGRWSGEEKLHAKVANLGTTKRASERARRIVDAEPYYYEFGDGWCVKVSVKLEADGRKAAQIRRRSSGFCGYDWMVDSILWNGEIKPKGAKS